MVLAICLILAKEHLTAMGFYRYPGLVTNQPWPLHAMQVKPTHAKSLAGNVQVSGHFRQ